jgi:hypothetical protein
MVVELQQCINRVPEDARPLLDMAAVIGDVIDEKLMRRLAPGADMVVWLSICEQAGVLHRGENNWRFQTRRVRHRVLDELADNPDLLSALHARVALAIEDVYPASVPWLVTIADHWQQADDINRRATTLLRAGRQALAHSLTRALEFVEQTESYDPQREDIPATEYIERALIRGEATAGLAHWQTAQRHFAQVLNLLDTAAWLPESGAYSRKTYHEQWRQQLRHRALLLFYLDSRSDPPPDAALFTALRYLAEVYAAQEQTHQAMYYALVYTNLAELYPASGAFTPGIGYALIAKLLQHTACRRFADHYRHLAQEDMLRCDPLHHALITRLLPDS